MTTSSRRPQRPPADEADAVRRLRLHGGRLTPAKRTVLELFTTSPVGLTAEQVRDALPDVDGATVYRTLAQFERAGILEHVHLGHGAATYRWAGAEVVPVVCEGCGAVVELSATELTDLAERVQRDHGMSLSIGHFALTGWCARCSSTA